jgi:hypothetical protein
MLAALSAVNVPERPRMRSSGTLSRPVGRPGYVAIARRPNFWRRRS